MIVKSMVHGLLSGSRGTWAAEEVREDEALLGLLDLAGAPEEVTVWRALEEMGALQGSGRLARIQNIWTRRILSRAPRRDLLHDGFFPGFCDGTLLEGSRRREGTKVYGGQRGRAVVGHDFRRTADRGPTSGR